MTRLQRAADSRLFSPDPYEQMLLDEQRMRWLSEVTRARHCEKCGKKLNGQTEERPGVTCCFKCSGASMRQMQQHGRRTGEVLGTPRRLR